MVVVVVVLVVVLVLLAAGGGGIALLLFSSSFCLSNDSNERKVVTTRSTKLVSFASLNSCLYCCCHIKHSSNQPRASEAVTTMHSRRRHLLLSRTILVLLLVCEVVQCVGVSHRYIDDAAAADTNFTLVNKSNVYGDDYENPQVHLGSASVDSEDDCRAICVNETTCNSYTWTPGKAAPKDDCHYTHNCWWRSDTVWHPKNTHNCLGQSGYKGSPPAPSPTPAPAPAPTPSPFPPAPANARNVLFVIFDDLRIMHGCLLYTSPSPRDRG